MKRKVVQKPIRINYSLLTIGNFDLYVKEAFDRILRNFIARPKEIYQILETLLITSVMVERIVKSKLKEINPALILEKIDVEDIALLSRRSGSLSKKPNKAIYDVKSAPISQLIARMSELKDYSKYSSGLTSFFNLRNRIFHAADDIVLKEADVAILLSKYIFPFLKDHIDCDDKLWNKVEKLAKVAHDAFQSDITRLLIQYGDSIESLKHDDIVNLINTEPAPNREQTITASQLLCPACSYEAMDFIEEVDFDYSDGQTWAYGNHFAQCRVCKIKLSEFRLEEILNHKDRYFKTNDDQFSAWMNAFKLDYDYQDYIDMGII